MPFPASINKFTKVLVIRYQDTILSICPLEYAVIISSSELLVGRKHVVMLPTQPSCNCGTCTFVNEAPHLNRLYLQGHNSGAFKGFRGE